MTTNPDTNSQQRFEVLDGLRGVAAILVMLYHYIGCFNLRDLTIHHLDFYFLSCGPLAVDFFFILSGFVLSAAYGDRITRGMSFSAYFLRRLIRIYPMYAIGMMLGAIGLILSAQAQGMALAWPNFGASAVLSVFMIPDYVGRYMVPLGVRFHGGGPFPLNPPGWSLFCEMVVSASFVVLYPRSKKVLGAVVLLSAGLLVLSILQMPHAVNSRLGFDMNVGAERKSVLPGVFRAMTGFYLGVLIFRFKDEAAWSDRAPFNWTIGIYWLFGLLTLCLISPFQFRGILPVLFVFVAAPLLVIWGARIQTMAPRTESVAKWLGHMSFPLYCVHFPIGQIVYLAGERSGFSLWTDVFVAAILSMVTALLTCAYIEEPLRAFLTNAAFFRSAQRPGVAQAGNQTGATMKIRRVARGRVGKSDC